MSILKVFSYLEGDDLEEFTQYMDSEYEDMLVAGSRTSNRLARYLPKSEMDVIRLIFTAAVRDFKLPSVRYSFLVAVMFYSLALEQRNVSERVKNIVDLELGLAVTHLMDDEKVEFEKALELIGMRWNEYVANPNEFVL